MLDIKLVKQQVNGCKQRAKKQQVPFSIDAEYILTLYANQNGLCALTNVPMTQCDKRPSTMHIDKVVPQLGYVPGNIQLLCAAANMIKLDRSQEETIQFLGVLKQCLTNTTSY
jgi:hypothetical protein